MFGQRIESVGRWFTRSQASTAIQGAVTLGILILITPTVLAQCEERWLEGPSWSEHLSSIAQWDPDGDGPRNPVLIAGGYRLGEALAHVVKFDGTSITPMGGPFDGDVLAVEVLGGELYAGGTFRHVAGVVTGPLVRWNGSAWAPEWPENPGTIHEMCSHNDQLVVAGEFPVVGGEVYGNIAIRDGDTWGPLSRGFGSPPTYFGRVSALASDGTYLFAGGNFQNADVPVNNIARWNGSWWEGLNGPNGNGIGAGVGSVAAILLVNGEVIVGGSFHDAGGVDVSQVAVWDGSSWRAMGELNAGVNSLVQYHGRIFAGGQFSFGGPAECPRRGIGRWNGVSWELVSCSVDSAVYDAAIFNGELVVVGSFVNAGGLGIGTLGRWTDVGIPWVAEQPASTRVALCGQARFRAAAAAGYDFDGALGFRWEIENPEVPDFWQQLSDGELVVSGLTVGTVSGAVSSQLSIQLSEFGSALHGRRIRCVMSNNCGSATSSFATLSVCGACIGDLDCGCSVDIGDLARLLAHFGTRAGATRSSGDLDGDGDVDLTDLSGLLARFGLTCS